MIFKTIVDNKIMIIPDVDNIFDLKKISASIDALLATTPFSSATVFAVNGKPYVKQSGKWVKSTNVVSIEKYLSIKQETTEEVAEVEARVSENKRAKRSALAVRDSNVVSKWCHLGKQGYVKLSQFADTKERWTKLLYNQTSVTNDIINAGYRVTPKDWACYKTNFATIWEHDPILKHANPTSQQCEARYVLNYIEEHNWAEEVWDLAWYPAGFSNFNGQRVLNRVHYSLRPTPKNVTKCPEVWAAYITGMFGDQRARFEAIIREWRKRVKLGYIEGDFTRPLGICMMGPGGGGKNTLVREIASTILFNDSLCQPVICNEWLTGDSLGHSWKLQFPVVSFADPEITAGTASSIQNKMKSLFTNEYVEIRPFYAAAKPMPALMLAFYSGNTDLREAGLPFERMEQSCREKWCVFKVGSGIAAIAGKFSRTALSETVLEYMAYLDATDTDAELMMEIREDSEGKKVKLPARFLVGHYFNPELDAKWSPLGNLEPRWRNIVQLLDTQVLHEDCPYSAGEILDALVENFRNKYDATKSQYDTISAVKLSYELQDIQSALPKRLTQVERRRDKRLYDWVFLSEGNSAINPHLVDRKAENQLKAAADAASDAVARGRVSKTMHKPTNVSLSSEKVWKDTDSKPKSNEPF